LVIAVHAGARQAHQSFNLADTLSVGVDRIQRDFEPMQRQVESWRQTQITDAQGASFSRSCQLNPNGSCFTNGET
jgi:hypothetical protein